MSNVSTLFLNLLVFYAYFVKSIPFNSISRDLEIINSCNATNTITKDELNRSLIERRFTRDPTTNFKCFLHCLYLKNGWIDSKGDFRSGVIKLALSESNLDIMSAKYLITICTKSHTAAGPCEKAFQFTTCFWRESEHLETIDSSSFQEDFSMEYGE